MIRALTLAPDPCPGLDPRPRHRSSNGGFLALRASHARKEVRVIERDHTSV